MGLVFTGEGQTGSALVTVQGQGSLTALGCVFRSNNATDSGGYENCLKNWLLCYHSTHFLHVLQVQFRQPPQLRLELMSANSTPSQPPLEVLSSAVARCWLLEQVLWQVQDMQEGPSMVPALAH